MEGMHYHLYRFRRRVVLLASEMSEQRCFVKTLQTRLSLKLNNTQYMHSSLVSQTANSANWQSWNSKFFCTKPPSTSFGATSAAQIIHQSCRCSPANTFDDDLPTPQRAFRFNSIAQQALLIEHCPWRIEVIINFTENFIHVTSDVYLNLLECGQFTKGRNSPHSPCVKV